MTIDSDFVFFLDRTLDAPLVKVWDAWTKAEQLQKWFGPKGCPISTHTLDFRVGGKYRGMIRSKDHGDNWFGGEYREIEPPTRLVFTWMWDEGPSGEVETLITITFREESDGKTVMTFHQTPFISVERRDAHVGGWTSLFNKLAAYAAKQQGKNQT